MSVKLDDGVIGFRTFQFNQIPEDDVKLAVIEISRLIMKAFKKHNDTVYISAVFSKKLNRKQATRRDTVETLFRKAFHQATSEFPKVRFHEVASFYSRYYDNYEEKWQTIATSKNIGTSPFYTDRYYIRIDYNAQPFRQYRPAICGYMHPAYRQGIAKFDEMPNTYGIGKIEGWSEDARCQAIATVVESIQNAIRNQDSESPLFSFVYNQTAVLDVSYTPCCDLFPSRNFF